MIVRRVYFLLQIFIIFVKRCSFQTSAVSEQNSKQVTLLNSLIEDRINVPHINMTGLILARGGSKGIPKKNLVLFKGQSLLRRTILTMKKFGRFSSIWVSTDSTEIMHEAENLGVFVHIRSNETATDTTSSLTSVQEFCKKKPGVSHIGLVQCTSPFLATDFLQKGYDLMTQGYDSAFSVTREYKLRWRELTDGIIAPINFDRKNRPRRQDWDGELVENGMFYFTNVALVNAGVLQGGRFYLTI